jgi:flagellar hook protein FlgE
VTLNIPGSTKRGPTRPLPIDADLTAATQYGSPFGVTDLSQDGYAAGQLWASSSRPTAS